MKTLIALAAVALLAGPVAAEEETRRGHVDVVFCIDRSGSMSGLEGDVVGGFNAFVANRPASLANSIVCFKASFPTILCF